MALGKAGKKLRNLKPIIEAKLQKKMESIEYQDRFNTILDRMERKFGKEHQFRMTVYSHFLLNGIKQNAEHWRNYIKNYEI
jgi:hypothetical protein